MASLQSRLDEFKEAFESAAPPHNAQHEASETMDRATTELRTSGLVLPIQFPRKKTTGIKLALPPTVKKDGY